MAETDNARLFVIVEGYVQGVGFRYFVQDSAVALGLCGWVRNRWSGDVEIVAEGDRQALEKLIAALRRGPRVARVTGVSPEWGDFTGEFRSFFIMTTY